MSTGGRRAADRYWMASWSRAAARFDGGSFRISYEWKEMLTYWEDGVGYIFDCGK